MFNKNKKKQIVESDFAFLLERGFVMEKFVRPPDVECVYSLNNLEINAQYYIGVLPSYKKTMCFDVTVTVGDERRNLLQCIDIFGFDSIYELMMKIRYLPASDQITEYAKFLQENIDMLLTKC